MSSIWKLPPAVEEDLLRLDDYTRRYLAGELSPVAFKVFRVPLGIYEQRTPGRFMLRVRCPAGVVTPPQLRALARVSRKVGNGVLHVTTRQDVQIHDVRAQDVPPALAALLEAGLSTWGGGGNSVRNVTACPLAGACPDESFDVTPVALEVTEKLLAADGALQMPRKFKTALSGCGKDCVGARVNDVGFVARRQEGRDGFEVWVGGGLGASSRTGRLLEPFVPVEQACAVAEAARRVFSAHGNRKDRRRARLRFLVESLGFAQFQVLYREELAALSPLQIADRQPQIANRQPQIANRKSQIANREYLWLPLFLGDLRADHADSLAGIVERHGLTMRTSDDQNIVLRDLPANARDTVASDLAAAGLETDLPPVLRRLVACAGATTCRLGICRSRDLATAVRTALESRPGLAQRLGDTRLHISGCPNACGRHPLGDIALSGGARQVDGKLVPHYLLQRDGGARNGQPVLAAGNERIPARHVPTVLVDLLAGGTGTPPDVVAAPLHHDWGADEPFSLAGRGPGECSAGMLDLVEADLQGAHAALAENRLESAAGLAARALLITRGLEARDFRRAGAHFLARFVERGLAAESLRPVLAALQDDPAGLAPDGVGELVAAVQALYDGMDGALRFPGEVDDEETSASPDSAEEAAADREADLRGVTCPLNYVRTKLLLQTMAPGKVLAVLLDGAGARNVPESVAGDGHALLGMEPHQGAWRLRIRKGGC